MSNTIDARGLSCPQPVILTMNAIKKTKEKELVVLVDTDAAKENVSRAATSQGWAATEIQSESEGYRIILRKGN
jgi:tRNA 2-thiouridine synthesizing protein A